MNLPILENLLKSHTKDLYLFYLWLNESFECGNFSFSSDETKSFQAYRRRDLTALQIKKKLRGQTDMSAATLTKYLNWYTELYGDLIHFESDSAMVFIEHHKFIEIQAALERDWATYAERNRVIRVLFYMVLQCYRFEGFTRSQENLARDIGMQKQQVVAALDYIVSKDWIRISKEAYYDAGANGCHARYYKLVADLIPSYMRGFSWINRRLAEPK